MALEKGNLTIDSENIFPIIKKWLYSDTDIFVRELVSNASDAITKLKKLVEMGEAKNITEDENYRIDISLNKDNKTIKIKDNGIGMTADEIKEYINNIAFSGATAFMEKYSDKMDQSADIIGHFGLGFYSAFMVAEKITIDSLSYKEEAQAALWTCEGATEFELEDGKKEDRGTEITLYINEDGKDFLEEYKLRETIKKYCEFMPVEIYFTNEIDKREPEKDEDGNIIIEEPKPVNDPSPLWLKTPSDVTDDEYKEFYRKVFFDFSEPLFWIHLNMDYPFNLKGILYFPKLKHELESIEGQVKLYNNQVFIADNVKEVIPEFLLLLKGVIDCPDLPLNVSRSFLQNDANVQKMSGYISKKVADKLNSMFKKDREKFNSYWEDISPFIKYGCVKEKSFFEKIQKSIVYKDIYGNFVTAEEYKEINKDKAGDNIFYVSNEQQQAQYIKLFKDQGLDAVVLPTRLDNPFISYLESYDTDLKFARIDADLNETLKDSENENTLSDDEKESLDKLFKDTLQKDNLKTRVENLKSDSVSGVILLSEESRRMQEMSEMFGQGINMGMLPADETLVLNNKNPLIQTLLKLKEEPERAEDTKLIVEQIYDLAMISHKPLDVNSMNKFIERSNKILELVSEK